MWKNNTFKTKAFHSDKGVCQVLIPHIPIGLVRSMAEASRQCIREHPDLEDHPYLCEMVGWSPMNDSKSYTVHTHTLKDADFPSPPDKKSTLKLGKHNLCIINTANNDLTCWDKTDNFTKPIVKKKLL